MKVWGIVLAAGSGTRFGGAKQFSALSGRRLVDRAVDIAISVCDDVVVVLPAGVAWTGRRVSAVAVGGPTRAASVGSALAAVPGEISIVVVHDAAHPLVSRALFESVITKVREGADGAVPVLPATETAARVVDGRLSATEPARGWFIVQMPHAFRTSCLRAAHTAQPDANDDATLLVNLGFRVVTCPGDPGNIHVSTPQELALAERLLTPSFGRRSGGHP